MSESGCGADLEASCGIASFEGSTLLNAAEEFDPPLELISVVKESSWAERFRDLSALLPIVVDGAGLFAGAAGWVLLPIVTEGGEEAGEIESSDSSVRLKYSDSTLETESRGAL